MKKRSILGMILLTIVTLGIYGLYWYISFQSELKQKTNEGFGGFMHFVMTIITFGIYGLYWQYAAGKRLAKLGASDNAVLYLVLSFFLIGVINPLIMQSQANKLAK